MTTAAPAEAPAPGAAAIVDPDYRIGRGDVLRITVYGHADLTQTVIVEGNGTFTFPLIGSVTAADFTPGQIEGAIRNRLASGFVRNPQVSVVVQEVRSKYVYVIGEVAKPGKYPLAGTMQIVEILSTAGPLGPEASPEVVVVRPPAASKVDRPIRPEDAKAGAKPADVYRVDIRDIQAGQFDKNITLRANDTVFVPKVGRIFVSGEVRNPGAFPYTNTLTPRQAIALAGGFTDVASKGSVRVARMVGGKNKEIKLKLDQPLQPGDTVIVKKRWF